MAKVKSVTGNDLRTAALIVATLLLPRLSPAVAATTLTEPLQSTVVDFTHAKLHEESENAKEAQRCFKVVDDEDTESGKALQVRLSKPLVRRKEGFAVLRTAGTAEPLATGTYRVTVRMKVQGMLDSLGSCVAIRAGNQTREVWMNEFAEEDTYQEFTLDFESRPGDIVTKRDLAPWGAPGGPGNLVPTNALPGVAADLARNDAPWTNKVSYWLAQRVVIPRLRLSPSEVPKQAELIAQALADLGPDGIPFDEEAENPPLSEEVVTYINGHGASRPNGAVAISFPQNTTGQGRSSTRGASTPQPTLRNLTVDWIKVEQRPEPDHLVLREARCRYPWRRPGETQPITLWLHNRSGAPQSNTVRLLLRSGLRHEETLLETEVALADGGYHTLRHEWNIPSDQRPWGQTLVAQVVRDGKVVSEERTWFALHQFANAVMVHDPPNTRRFLHPYASAPPATQNMKEIFGANGTIYDSAGVVPDPDVFYEPYVVGNGSFFMSIPTLTSITMGLRNRGVAPLFYLESNGSAERALEIFWDHPDWIPKLPANMDAFLINRAKTSEEWLKWYRGELKTERNEPPDIARAGGAYSGQLVALNGIVKENVDRVIQGTIKLCEHTDFTGVRWDGLPFRAHNGKSLGGTWGKTPEELHEISAANLRRFRDEVRAKFPNFELRANGGLSALEEKQEDPYDFDKAFEILRGDPLHVELVTGHGSIMEEMWMGYAGFGTYANNCLHYLRACHFENAAFKMAGGHNGHMLWFYDGRSQYTPDEVYQQLFTFLGGAHLDGSFGPIVESVHELGVYAVRFGEYFWDPALRPISNMVDKVEADAEADLWYTETGFEKTTDEGRYIYVIPVINPPTTELWLQNRFGLLPEPVREPIGLTVRTPDGCGEVTGAFLLENSPYPHVRPIEFEDSGSDVYVEVPELVVFEVVVLEWEKE